MPMVPRSLGGAYDQQFVQSILICVTDKPTHPFREQCVGGREDNTLAETLNDSKTSDSWPVTEFSELWREEIQQRAQSDRHQQHDLSTIFLRHLSAWNLRDHVAPKERRQHQRLLSLAPLKVDEVWIRAIAIGHRDDRH